MLVILFVFFKYFITQSKSELSLMPKVTNSPSEIPLPVKSNENKPIP
jgi:hypothetical protein